MEDIQPRFIPDMSRYNQILIVDGVPINDVNFVKNNRAEIASMLGNNVAFNENFDPPFEGSESEAFDSWIPKGVQSPDEIMTFMDNLKQNKDG